MSLIAELKRRKVFQIGAAYLVLAWLAVQAVSIGFPAFDAPPWVLRVFILIALLGFPIAVVMAWVYETTPNGLKIDASSTGSKRLFAAATLLVVLALGWYFHGQTMPQTAATAPAATARPTPVAAVAAPPKSIAVLPFVNMSGEAENEFFSDGVSEEILNSLARIDGMQVVGRTSSFQFKGKNEDLRTIGEKLGVASILEGSVRREGERARITAQLIRASDGIHLWSQTYDRTLKDTLAVQLDIAEQVAGALDVVLDDQQRTRMREAGIKNVDAFIAYQKGLKLFDDAHNPDRSPNLIDTLRLANVEFDKATTLEPDFSLAHFAATDLYDHLLISDNRTQAERIEARRAALRNLDLAAASSHDAQQRLFIEVDRQLLSDDWRGLSARIDAALAHEGCSAPNWLPQFANVFGYGERFENLGARITVCDPLGMGNFNRRAEAANWAGRPQLALDIVAAAEKTMGGASPLTIQRVRALIGLGRLDEARALLATVDANTEFFAIAQIVLGRASGESAATIHDRLQAFDRTGSQLNAWSHVDAVEASLSGNRVEANRRAAAFDARPGGALMLVLLTGLCQCGAPFDLDATPNFKARLAESGLHWPPPETIKYPPRTQERKP